MRRALLALLLGSMALSGAGAARAEFLDWTDRSWTAGALGPVTYTGGDLGAASITVTLSDPSGASSSGTPVLVSGVNGFDRALRISPNFANSSQSMRSEFRTGAPVTQLTFSVGDIDTGSNSSPYANWQDVAVVTAFLGGVEVAVTVVSTGAFVGIDTSNSWTTGLNAVVYGTRNLDESLTSGNATFRVDGPVDLVRVDYRPGNAIDGVPGEGPSAPNNQWVHFHDLVFQASADLSLAKVASTTTPAVGDTVTYTLTVANAGPATATGVRVADVLPAGLSYVAGSITGGTVRNAAGAPTLTWDQATLASGASAVLTYQATVNAPTGAANEYRNAAQVTVAPQPDPDSTPNNGATNTEDDRAQVTLTPTMPVSGFVYEDLDHDSARDGTETGTGLALYAKLVPSATPAGPASQVVAVDSATGAFGFASVAAGTYSIVIDTSNTAADVTPTFPSGWLRLEEADWIRSVTVASAAITGQNFGLHHGSRVQGVVFHDNGAGGGTANNGVRDGSEPGLAGVTLNPTATGCGGSCGSTTTAAGGTFTLWIPFAADGQTVTVTETNLVGYASTGGSAGTSGGAYTLATDSVAFTHASGSSITGLAFGDRQGADLSLTKIASSTTPAVGATVIYTLTLTNGGPLSANDITVADVLPPGVTYVPGSIAGGNSRSAAGNPTLTWTRSSSLASGASINLTYQVTVDAPTGAANEYRNAAQVTGSSQLDPDSTPNNGAGNGEDDQATVTLAPAFCAVTLVPDRSATVSAAQTVYFAHVLTNTGTASDTFDLASITSGGFTPSPIAYYRDLGTVGVYDAGTDVLLADTDGDTIPDSGSLAAAASIDLLVAATAPNAALSGSADVATTATSSLGASCSGSGAAFATATDTLDAGAGLSGFVYGDANHDATRNAGEGGTGLTLYAKLIPAALPAGPASQVVAVDPGTGSFAFPTATAGDWILVYDTSNAAADVAPTLPAGWLRTEEPDATRTVTLGSTQVAMQNFGLFHGSRVEGSVFDDDGTGGGIAGNGLLDGTEGGIAGVAVRAEASGCGGVCDVDTTDAAGAFTLWIPFAASGQGVGVVETNPASFVSTGGSAGTTGGGYAIATDTVTFANATGTVYGSVRFADFSGSGFAPNHQRAAMPGSTVFYPHVFSAGPSGSVRFSSSSVASPATGGWAQGVFHDADCSATLDATEPQLQPADAIAAGAGGTVCVILRESVPPNAASGVQDLVTVTATFTAAGGATGTFTVTDLTTAGLPSGLVLEKSVNKAAAEPGEVLVYTITYRNDGPAPITQLVIADSTPAWTTFVTGSASCGALPSALTACTPAAPPDPTGTVTWTFGGALAPSASGTVTYSTRID